MIRSRLDEVAKLVWCIFTPHSLSLPIFHIISYSKLNKYLYLKYEIKYIYALSKIKRYLNITKKKVTLQFYFQ